MNQHLDDYILRLTFRASPKMKLIDFEIPYKFIDKMIYQLKKGKENLEIKAKCECDVKQLDKAYLFGATASVDENGILEMENGDKFDLNQTIDCNALD
jgi:hypothetical protein